jgi:hypothetical protein
MTGLLARDFGSPAFGKKRSANFTNGTVTTPSGAVFPSIKNDLQVQ